MNNKKLPISLILLVLLPISLAILTLIGWVLDIDILKRGIASSVAMNPATAIGFILLGLEAGRVHFRNNVSLISGAGQLAIGLVIIASTLQLSDLILDTSFHIDTQLFSTKLDVESGHPSRMAPNTAFCFFVSAWAMQFLRSKSDLSILIAQLLMLIPILITLLAIIGYAYNVELFYGMGIFIPMAFNTAVAFLFLSVAVLFIYPDKGYMCIFTNTGSAGVIASILLPAALFIPFLLGWISLVGQREGFYDTAFGHALFVVLVITLLFSIIYIGIRRLFLADMYQQQVETKLRDSIVILRATLDNSPFLLWLKNPEGCYITVNKVFADCIGLKDIEQIVGKTDLDIWPKELAEKYRADDAEIMSTRRQMHMEEQGFDGKRIHWVETYKTPIIDGQGNVLGTTGFAIDITERKQVEQKTRALALRNQVLMQTATDGIHIMDEQGNILEANDAFCRLLGYTAEEMAHLNVVDWDACWTAEELETMFRESIGHNTIFETVHRRKDGTLFNVEISTSNVELDGQHYFFATSRDITVRKQTEEELRIAAIAFDSQQGMILTDPNGIILRVNKAFTHLTGYSAEEAIGKTPRLLSSGRHDQTFYQDLWENLLEKRYWQGEIWNQRKNGVIYPEWLTISAVPNADGQVTHYVGAFSDITQHKEAEAKIHRLAYYDPLTQLPNRRLLNDRLSQALAASARSGQYGALLFIDLDNFKILNDTLGHDMGDLLLKQVAHRLVTCVREGDTVARVGGDEFVVILEDLGDSSGEAATLVEVIGEKILTALNHTYQLDSHDYYSTTSVGITLFIGHLSSIEELLKRADIAMYHAKTSGRNAIHFFDPVMQAVVTAHATLEADLRRALEKNQFRLYFQMQVYHNHQIIGAEVLLRWQHPERGLVPPMEFISLLEETRLILPIGLWVLETACNQLKMWENTTATRHLQLAVNVSARQFHQDDFVEQVCSVLKKTAIKPDRLKLELTESLLLDNIDNSIIKMQMLKEIGVRFSMDDFGTGYSSLAYLTQLPLDQLKIDQSFVRNIGVKPADAIIVQTIIGMADNLGFEVIAEGVETEAQRAFLELHGCSACQGYLFGKPMPLLEFESSFNDFV